MCHGHLDPKHAARAAEARLAALAGDRRAGAAWRARLPAAPARLAAAFARKGGRCPAGKEARP
jgi:hypothetical protein